MQKSAESNNSLSNLSSPPNKGFKPSETESGDPHNFEITSLTSNALKTISE